MKLRFLSKRLRIMRTITQRLTLLLAVVTGGFGLVAAAYFGFVSMNDTAISTNNRITEFAFASDRLRADILQARRHEKDFLALRDDKYLDRHDSAIAAAHENAEKAGSLAPDYTTQSLIAEIRPYMQAYQDSFSEAAEVLRRVGYDEKSGLHGRLRQAVHEVEDLLKQHDNVELTASMLMMRRHEKDYLQRKYEKYIGRMAKEQTTFAKRLAASRLPSEVQSLITTRVKDYHRDFLALTDGYKALAEKTQAIEDAVRQIEPRLEQLDAETAQLLVWNREEHAATTQFITWLFAGLLLAVTVAASLLLFATTRSITRPLGKLGHTIAEIAAGSRDARAELDTGDEMQELGDAIDSMMDERGRFMQTEQENEALNNSIMSILRTVSRLGQGDFTSEAPVNEDITGALGDALNQMSDGIAKTLGEVSLASAQVMAGTRQAREATAESRETVLSTVRGMNEIRTTIQETAKRIKRLGERSQEIGGIVKLIDTIAERTNVLALNANMQAAQAGEAGRGFMVVAAEVQRLAESSKQATDQIAKLISGIQVETGEAISTMDRSIEEVVEGSQLAEKGATEMNLTDEAVEAVNALGAQLQEAVRAFRLPGEYVAEGDTNVSVRVAAA